MSFEIGRIYNRRKDLHAVFGGQQQGGISTPAPSPLIFLFTGDSGKQYGYEDGCSKDTPAGTRRPGISGPQPTTGRQAGTALCQANSGGTWGTSYELADGLTRLRQLAVESQVYGGRDWFSTPPARRVAGMPDVR